jgi:hypothetical protein
MAIHSNFLGSVTVSGEEAKALTRQLARGRAKKGAALAAANGRVLATQYAKKKVVTIKLNVQIRSKKK